MTESVRLLTKLDRFEIASVLVASGVLGIAALTLAANLTGMAVPDQCLATEAIDLEGAVDCDTNTVGAFNALAEWGDLLSPALAVLPWAAGLLLGTAVIAREVEHRTLVFAWSLTPSRPRWLLRRSMLPVLGLALATLFLASAATVLQAAERPLIDPLATFEDHGSRGPLLMARGVLALSVATLVGSLMGRMLPTLIVSTLLSLTIFGVSVMAFPYWAPQRALEDDDGFIATGSVILDIRHKLADGRVAEFGALPGEAGLPAESPEFWDWYEKNVTTIPFGYEPGQALDLALRESAGTLVLTLVLLGVTGRILERRRPY